VANTLANTLRQAKQEEDRLADVQGNMRQLHAAIAQVEAVAHEVRTNLPTAAYTAVAPEDSQGSQAVKGLPELRMRENGEALMQERRMAERRWMEERRRYMLAEGRISPQQLALQRKDMRAEATSFDADELSLWSAQARHPVQLTYLSPQEHESLDAITHSLARLNAKFAREAASSSSKAR
jgi:hypothetical protein